MYVCACVEDIYPHVYLMRECCVCAMCVCGWGRHKSVLMGPCEYIFVGCKVTLYINLAANLTRMTDKGHIVLTYLEYILCDWTVTYISRIYPT